MVSMLRVRPPRTRLPVWRWLRPAWWCNRHTTRLLAREAAEWRRGEYTTPVSPDERRIR